jgi:hypothetical protein
MRCSLVILTLFAPALVGCWSSRWLDRRAKYERPSRAAVFRDPLTAGQLVIHADFYLPPGHRMISELTSERQLISDLLGVPAGKEPIHVFLFADEAAYREHVAQKYPDFPERRAIFVETDVQLSVYAHWSDYVADDLRHEVAHGYLHSSVPNLPLWLDEGLAEYFEVARGRMGVNRAHIDYLQARQSANGWRPDLRRLEQLTAAGAMEQFDYAEAWLWVHFLLESHPGGRDMLAAYLSTLRNGEPPPLLSATLAQHMPEPHAVESALAAHLRSLAL